LVGRHKKEKTKKEKAFTEKTKNQKGNDE